MTGVATTVMGSSRLESTKPSLWIYPKTLWIYGELPYRAVYWTTFFVGGKRLVSFEFSTDVLESKMAVTRKTVILNVVRHIEKQTLTGVALDTTSGVALDTTSGVALDTTSGVALDTTSGVALDTTGVAFDTTTVVWLSTNKPVVWLSDTTGGVALTQTSGVALELHSGVT
ncbi:hypothetical protein Hamer_G019243 [Homarus americanus]|uniref:Uncharacterized protein n=1 Tax=Homarus americanus TaxID=6706 RepID=A0A8J5JCA7_HOMAM|nr:hypothetical protein Hamer_G019243 [Homarus americanus]